MKLLIIEYQGSRIDSVLLTAGAICVSYLSRRNSIIVHIIEEGEFSS